jgi:hypothetical protein
MSGIGEDDMLPGLVDGSRAGPPEDVGGRGGYERFLAAWCDPEGPEHADCRRWVGPPYDPRASIRGPLAGRSGSQRRGARSERFRTTLDATSDAEVAAVIEASRREVA